MAFMGSHGDEFITIDNLKGFQCDPATEWIFSEGGPMVIAEVFLILAFFNQKRA